MESVQGELIAHVDAAIQSVDSLVASLQLQVQGDHLKNTLSNVDRVTSDLTGVSADLKRVVNTQVPTIVNNADKAFANLNEITSDLQKADLAATVESLYDHIDATVVSADSLLVDLKAHPKRYVQVSVFGKKDK